MRWIVLACVMLAGCENTMNGFGQDMQSAGASLSRYAAPTPPPPPPLPLSQYANPPAYDDGDPPYQSQSYRPDQPNMTPYHDPNQPVQLNNP